MTSFSSLPDQISLLLPIHLRNHRNIHPGYDYIHTATDAANKVTSTASTSSASSSSAATTSRRARRAAASPAARPTPSTGPLPSPTAPPHVVGHVHPVRPHDPRYPDLGRRVGVGVVVPLLWRGRGVGVAGGAGDADVGGGGTGGDDVGDGGAGGAATLAAVWGAAVRQRWLKGAVEELGVRWGRQVCETGQ